MRVGGIYEIVNTANGKRYIGSAIDLGRRQIRHRHALRKGAHHNAHLQRAWNKHGESAFEFKTLLICAADDLLLYEQLAFAAMRPEYNVNPVAGSAAGTTHSVATRTKIAEAHLGKAKHTVESKAAIGASSRGRTWSAAAKSALSESRRGRLTGPLSETTYAKKYTPATRAKLSASLTGREFSDEHCARLSEANRRRVITEATRTKMRESAIRRAIAEGRRVPI